jgi:hypothetical protein
MSVSLQTIVNDFYDFYEPYWAKVTFIVTAIFFVTIAMIKRVILHVFMYI